MTSTFLSATFQQGLLQVGEQAADQVDLAAQPQPHVGGNLVVAAAPGVQALARNAHQLGQAGFDVEVNVLQVELPLETASLDFGRDLGHAFLDGGVVVGVDDSLCGQHPGMCQGALNVGLPQALVKKYAGGVAFDQIAHGLGEEGRPGF